MTTDPASIPELVKRLRRLGQHDKDWAEAALGEEAADALERQSAVIAELREALVVAADTIQYCNPILATSEKEVILRCRALSLTPSGVSKVPETEMPT